MLKNIYLLLILFFFSSLTARAQVVPGYQGKRFFVEGNFGYFPAFMGPTKNDKAVRSGEAREENFFAFNTRFKGTLGYAIGRRLTMRLDVDDYTTGFVGEDINFRLGTEIFSFESFNRIDANTVHVGVDITGSIKGMWGLAPLGYSYGGSIGYGVAKTTSALRGIDDVEWTSETQAFIAENVLIDDYRYGIISFRAFFRKILVGNLFFSGGIESGLVLNRFIEDSPGQSAGFVEEDRPQAENRVLRHNLLYVQVGLGYLLF